MDDIEPRKIVAICGHGRDGQMRQLEELRVKHVGRPILIERLRRVGL